MSALLPSDYPEFLQNLKVTIWARQTRAILAVNRKLIALYWEIGQQIVERQETASWGDSVITQLERDLQNALLVKLWDFWVELGNGFAFMGSEYPL